MANAGRTPWQKAKDIDSSIKRLTAWRETLAIPLMDQRDACDHDYSDKAVDFFKTCKLCGKVAFDQ